MKITKTDIQMLLTESAEAGDDEMVKICKAALRGNATAIRECERVITEIVRESDDDTGYSLEKG